jgi:hypothetical protein
VTANFKYKFMFRNGLFISYSHEDEKWLDTLLKFLKPHTRDEKITVWSDRQIQPGAHWESEIIDHLRSARVAVLLVSANFLASDYIARVELPVLLEMYRNRELIIVWIPVGHSAFSITELKEIEAASSPSQPLDQLSKPERDQLFVAIAEKIANAMNLNAIGNVFKMIDDFVPQQKAFIDDKELDDRPTDYSVQAQQLHDVIELKNRDNFVVETISAEDLDNLDKDSKTLIRSFESTMKDLFERWVELRPKSYSRDPVIRADARAEMADIRKDLCEQLNAILDYLISLHKNLHDHYHHVRYLCSQ